MNIDFKSRKTIAWVAFFLLKKVLLLFLFCFFSSFKAQAQELNARVQINTEQIQGTNKQVFQTLQTALTEFLNNRKWSDTQFSNGEKIDCSFALTIKSIEGENYAAELQVQTRRPVFGSMLMTTLINHRDVDVNFPYKEFEPLVFNNNTIEHNLTAIFAYYVYLILGFDFDSFSLMGGTSFFQTAENIANMGQGMQLPGWTSIENTRSRSSVITSILDNSGKLYRELMYGYHRQGLDEMTLGVERGRSKIWTVLPNIEKIRQMKSNSPLMFLFSDAKLEEVAEIFSKASSEEKKQVYNLLNKVYPTMGSRYSLLSE